MGTDVFSVRLKPDPRLAPADLPKIHVGGSIAPKMLTLYYRLEGTLETLRIPPPENPLKTSNPPSGPLWAHTCFEAFLATPQKTAAHYLEYNFAPSGQWQSYAFSTYRTLLPDFPHIPPPHSFWQHEKTRLCLKVEIPLVLDFLSNSPLPDPAQNIVTTPPAMPPPLYLGLSAVLEEANGGLLYYALNHSPEKPDFHHPDNFSLTLPQP